MATAFELYITTDALNHNTESILIVLVMLESLQKLVVLGERLVSSCLRHVVSAVVQLLPPEGGPLLPLVPHIRIDQLPQLLIVCNLPSLLESQRLSQIVINILGTNWYSILVIHDQPTYPILVKRLLRKSGFAGGLEDSSPGFFLLLLLLLLNAKFDLFQVLHKTEATSCSKSWCFFPVLAKLSALFWPLP